MKQGSVSTAANSQRLPSSFLGFPGVWVGKESACNAGDAGSTPGSGRSPGGRHGNPLWYSCLKNPLDKGAWRLQSIGSQSRIWVKRLSTHACKVFPAPSQILWGPSAGLSPYWIIWYPTPLRMQQLPPRASSLWVLGENGLNTTMHSSTAQPKMPAGVWKETVCIFPSSSVPRDWKHFPEWLEKMSIFIMGGMNLLWRSLIECPIVTISLHWILNINMQNQKRQPDCEKSPKFILQCC